jgi:hypothetical protein
MPRTLATRLRQAVPARAPFAAALLLALFSALCGFAPSVLQLSGTKASAAVASAQPPARTLSLDERIRYQRAVEEVYWRHTLWPKQNAVSKPALEEVAPLEVTRQRVLDVLRLSDALGRQWQRPLTAAALQAEVARMARETRQPEVLRELWAALDNDAFVVAEVLARPLLVERLTRSYYASDENFHGALRAKVEAELRARPTLDALRKGDGKFSQVEAVKVARKAPRVVSGTDTAAGAVAAATATTGKGATLELTAEEWEAETARLREMLGAESCETCGAESLPVGGVSNLQEDDDSFYVTSVVATTGKRLKVARVEWTKTSFDTWWAGARAGFEADAASEGFDYKLAQINQLAADDTWTPTKALPEATGTVVWTGTEMIVWGGGKQNSGARYNPATDTWTPTSTTNVPIHRGGHTAVWTGTEMIVWGGCERSFDFCGTNDGGRYNPVSDTWAGISLTNAPSPRSRHVAVWTGSKMIIWAGNHHGYNNRANPINSGGIYDPASDSWTTMNTTNAPGGGSSFTAVWTGSEMIAWGGNSSFGGRYNPDTDRWTPTNPVNAPSPRSNHTAIWTGSEMIVWGGTSGTGSLNTGGRYNPATDTWTPTSTTDAPSPRYLHTAIWTGTEMIVWGGSEPLPTNTGGRYNPATDSWTATNTANAPPPKSGHVAVWTGELMIVWSVTENKTGGRYNPANDTWTPTDNNDSPPSMRFGVWTGAEMIIWVPTGYCWSGDCPSLSKRYDPATYTWRPMSNAGEPATPPSDRPIAAVWTGTEMIVWGSDPGPYGAPGEGGRYNPQTDSWRPVTTNGAPVSRSYFTGVWTGSELIVWGGQGNDGTLQNTGGRYNPSNDTWRPTSTVGAPEPRLIHTAVWTGAEMIVWGGSGQSLAHFNNGGRYNPANDTWTPTSTSGAPAARRYHTAVWTGTEMIVWGGRIGDYNDSAGLLNTGGRYNPSSDSWTPTGMTGAPGPRFKHTAVWTGKLMIVWGGISPNAVGYAVSTNTGGRYQPDADAWTPTSTLRAPGRRQDHIAFWTGTGMLVWGGVADDGSPTHGGYYSAPGASNGNTPPSVRITAPADNSTFDSGATINFTTETSDSDGTISSVHFYANDALIGSDSTAPFSFAWPEVRGGSYTIKALATDDAGGVTTSAAVRLTVNPSTAPPSCVLHTPVNGSTYTTQSIIAFKATASANRDRTLKTVEFLEGNHVRNTFGPGGTYQFNTSGYQAGTYSFTVRCTDSADVSYTTPPTVFTVSAATNTVRITGQIIGSGGGSVSNVRVRLDGAPGTSPQFSDTNLNGSFQFSNLPSGGNYTVTPESAIYSFSPPSQSFPSLTQNYDDANFRAQNISHTISGRLSDASGNAIHPATITLSGSKSATAATDFNGNYFFSNLATGGTYTVQPFRNQYSFAPPTRTFANLSASQTADFTGTAMTYTVAGRISNAAGAGLAGVTVSLNGASGLSATTDASGNYSFANLAASANYTITPAKAGYNFTPGSRSYANLAGNQTSDFRGVPVSQSVILQAEDFDDAWDGLAYHDTTEGNLGGQYRTSGVDITNCPNGTCAYMVGWNKAGEWLSYTVSVAETGTYTLSLRAANTAAGGTLHVEVDGVDATGALAVPNTGDPYGWASVTKSGINLSAGQHTVKLSIDTESVQGWAGNFDSLTLTKEVPAPPQGSRHNVALASNGGVATASSQLNGSFPVAAAINGDRAQLYLPDGRYNMWHGATTAKPDWLQVEFNGAKTIDEIVVVTQQDDYNNAVEPTQGTTFTKYGLTGFEVQYWNGSGWATVPGGSVTGNDRVLRKFSFGAVTTTKMRALIHAGADGYSRVWEFEAWGTAAQTTPPPSGRINVAAESNGATATSSSQFNGSFPVAAAINGDRHRLFLPDGRYNIWHSAAGAAKPDWLQVNFNGAKTITEINVATMQDDYHNPVEPTEATTFSAYGLTHFQVQYWDGANWATVPGGSVTANDRVWRRFTFPALTTDKIRVLVHATTDGYSRIMELEAY